MIEMCKLYRHYLCLTHSLTFIPDSRDLETRKKKKARERERETEKKRYKRKERNGDSGNKQRTSF